MTGCHKNIQNACNIYLTGRKQAEIDNCFSVITTFQEFGLKPCKDHKTNCSCWESLNVTDVKSCIENNGGKCGKNNGTNIYTCTFKFPQS